jgi:hypothetical protein
MSDTDTTLPETPQGVIINNQGGVCPVQIDGTVDGTPFYFRARGEFWTLGIGQEPIGEPDWFWGQRYSQEKYVAGWMPLDEARSFLFEAIARYRSGETGNWDAYFEEREIEAGLRFEPSFEELEQKEKFKEHVARYRGILEKARAEGKIPPAA